MLAPAAPVSRTARAAARARRRRAIVRWRDDGLAFVPAPQPGDLVSLHWDFVCDVLSPVAAAALERANRRALAAVASRG